MIEVIGLTKRYGPNTAVDSVSFTVPKGKIYGFLGPNGAGKSTTMNMITGFLSATDGSIKIDGCDIFDEPIKAKRKIGYLPEIPPVYPDMTPLEYLNFAAQLKGIAKKDREAQISAVMKKTEITDMQDRLIRNLSKGYCQRVGLACALLGDPEVLILDEPTVGLDPKQIAEMRTLIAALREKHTVLLSSHILSEVSAICDCVIIISKGKIVALDTPDSLAQLMHGKSTVSVTVQGSEEEVSAALRKAMPNAEIEILARESTEETSLCVNGSGRSLRAEIGCALMRAGLACLWLSESRVSLEDVFLELTDDDKNIQGEVPAADEFENMQAEEDESNDSNI